MALSGCVQQSPSREKCTFSLLSQIPAEMEENFTSIKKEVSDIFYFFNINLFNWRLITLQYCSGFAISMFFLEHIPSILGTKMNEPKLNEHATF